MEFVTTKRHSRPKKKAVKISQESAINRLLAEAYYNPREPGSYSGARALQRRVKPRASAEDVFGWLKSQDAYTLHKGIRRRFPRRKTIVSGIREQWQCDLIDLSSLKKHNRGMTFVLTAIDVFSKVGYAVPIRNKTSTWMIKGLTLLFKKAGHVPRTLQTDKGGEFLNKPVQAFLKKRGVHHFVSENDDIKCAVVERWNRTLKEKLWRYFTKHETLHYLKALPQLVESYNKSHHRSLGMVPLEVNTTNQETVWQRLYGVGSVKKSAPEKKKRKKDELKVGDRVRISKSKAMFKKGYLPGWSAETFEVVSVLKTTPLTYKLRDEAGVSIAGSFYGQELQAVNVPVDKVYNIEKVLERRGNKLLVRWEGYPPAFDSWIPQSGVVVKKNKTPR